MVAAARHVFDLENDPLFRVALFTKSAERHVLVVTAHHLVCGLLVTRAAAARA